ncbi:MAG TPA: HXXEE domain-containing protein [Candidatus Udaeobacter sp.]|nr:HXXEE domain-containing protein [Candidatus Udaeobacter sp.]
MNPRWLYWLPLGAASLHIFEEFAFPGGFAAWYRRHRPGIERSITRRFLLIVNGLLLVLCYDVAALHDRPLGVFLWLLVAALLFANGLWHLRASLRTRSYSPGVVTGIVVYLPLALLGYLRFLRTGAVSPARAVLAFAIGASYQFWANLLHHWRAGKVAAPVGR